MSSSYESHLSGYKTIIVSKNTNNVTRAYAMVIKGWKCENNPDVAGSVKKASVVEKVV